VREQGSAPCKEEFGFAVVRRVGAETSPWGPEAGSAPLLKAGRLAPTWVQGVASRP
jgi:hypothetical protein